MTGDDTRHQFTVRLLGRPFPMVFAMAGRTVDDLPGDDNRPYGETTVFARGSDALAEVLDRAAVRLGLSGLRGESVSATLAWIRFRESEDDRFAYDDRLCWAHQFTVVDASGQVTLAQRLEHVLVEDLLRTAEAGLIDGDPLQPYLIPTIPQGGLEPWSLDWPTLIGHLQMFWVALGAMATVEGAIALVKRLRGRLDGAPAVLAEAQALAGGTPELLWDIFRHRPVLPAQAAEWLRCSTEDAETLLFALGLDDRGDGVWEPDASEDARIMSNALIEFRSEMQLLGSQRGVLATRLQHLLETGERLPLPDIGEWERQFDVAVDPEDDPYFAEVDEDEIARERRRFELPLERLRLECGCDDPACNATARITFAGHDRLRFEVDPPGHFEAASGFLERLALEQAERED